MKANQDVEKNVYDFLDLVHTTTAEREVDVDDLLYESDYEFCASPVSGKPIGKETYDDGTDSLFHSKNDLAVEIGDVSKSNWENGSESTMEPNSWQGWEGIKKPEKVDFQSSIKKDGAWSKWDAGIENEPALYRTETPEVQQGWGGSNKTFVDNGNSEKTNNLNQWNENRAADGAWSSSGWGVTSESKTSKTWSNSNKPASNTDMTSKAVTGNDDNLEKASFGPLSESNKWNENRAEDHGDGAWGLTNASKNCSSSDGPSKGGTGNSYTHENADLGSSFKSDKWDVNNSATDHGESTWVSTGGSESWKNTAKTTWSTDGTRKAGTWNSPISEKASFGRSSEPNKWKEKRTTHNEDSAWGSRGWGSTDAACSSQKSPLEDVWNTEGKARTDNSINNHAKVNTESSYVEKLDEAKTADNGNNGWKSRGWSSTDGPRSWKNSFPRTGVKSDEQRGRNSIGSSSMKRNAEVLTREEEQILFEVEPVFCSAKKILHDARYFSGHYAYPYCIHS